MKRIKDGCIKLKNWYQGKGRRGKLLFYSALLSLLAGLALYLGVKGLAGGLLDQQMSARWGEGSAHISCFFQTRPDGEEGDGRRDAIEAFRHGVDKALEEAGVENSSTNPGARMWIDAFSADGRITLQSGKTKLEAHAIGVGGEFFRFHPLMLLEGNFFSEEDNNRDYCILDEEAAWQLFGSNNIAGKMVSVGGNPLIVSGVIRREEGRLEKAAGLDATIVYVSYETLREQGSDGGINHYELVMPDPVSGFVLKYVREKLASDDKTCLVIENSKRFNWPQLLKVSLEFGTRSMGRRGILYPYWENLARGWEDILSPLVLVSCLFFLYPLVIAIAGLWYGWTHRKWSFRDLGRLWENIREKIRNTKRRKEVVSLKKRKEAADEKV